MKRLGLMALLALLLMAQPMQLISRIDFCIRPKDIRTTEVVYDGANNTYVQYWPTGVECIPFYAPEDAGIVFTRLQWAGPGYG